AGGVRLNLRLTAAPTQLVEDTEVGDLQNPRSEGPPRWIESDRSTPDCEKDVLDDLFGRGAVQSLDSQVKNQSRITAIERSKRFLRSGGELAHQLLVAVILVGWHQAKSVVHCSLLHYD